MRVTTGFQSQYGWHSAAGSTVRAGLLALLLLLTMTGCGLKTSYRYMDWLVAWSVDDYVQWTKPQQRHFDRRLAELLHWHQATQLSNYSDFLSRFKQQVKQPLSTEKLQPYWQQLAGFWRQLMGKSAPDIAFMLASLDDRQFAELEANLNERQAEHQQKYAPSKANELQAKRIKKTQRLLRRFIGKLNPQQQALISSWHQDREQATAQWLRNRQAWTEQLIDAMHFRQAELFDSKIKQLFVYPEQLWDADYARQAESNLAAALQLVVSLQVSLTAQQHSKLAAELDRWILLFNDLAAEATAG
jgi:hypothetical protein